MRISSGDSSLLAMATATRPAPDPNSIIETGVRSEDEIKGGSNSRSVAGWTYNDRA